MRAAGRKRLRNKPVLSLTKTKIGKAEGLILSGPPDEAQAAVVTTISSLDRAARKGIIHPANAARRKSRLMKKLNKARPASSAE